MNNNRRFDSDNSLREINEEKLKKYLKYIIDAEIKKPISKMNADLISECVDLYLSIDGQEITISEEKIKSTVKSIVDRYYKPKKRLHIVLKVAAACIAVLFTVQFISAAAFHENLAEDVYNEIQYVVSHFTHHNDDRAGF